MRNPRKAQIVWSFAVWTAIVANFIAAFSTQDASSLFLCESSLQQDTDQDERPTRLVVRTSSLTTKGASVSHEEASRSGRKTASSGGRSQSDVSKQLRGLSDPEVFPQSKSKPWPSQDSKHASPGYKGKRPDPNLSGTTAASSTIINKEQLRKLPRTDPRRPKSRWSPKLTPEEKRERTRLRRKSAREAMTSEERARWNHKKTSRRSQRMENMTQEQYSDFTANRSAKAKARLKQLKEENPDVYEQRKRVRTERARKTLQEDPERRLVYNARRRERRNELKKAERKGIPAPPARTRNQFRRESSSDPSISSLSEKSRDGARKKSPSSPRGNLVASQSSAGLQLQSMRDPSSLQQLPQRQRQQKQQQQQQIQQPAWSQGSDGSIPGEVAAQDLFHQWRAEGPDLHHPLL